MVLPLAAVGGVMGAIEAASNIANVIQVGIMVSDMLTPTLETYEGKIETLEQATTSWQNSFIRDIPLNGLDYLKTATDYIRDGIWDAAQLQTSMIASSSDLAQNMKIPIKDAMDMMFQSQITISKLAAALPGETSGYASVYRSLAGTLSKQFRGDDFKAAAEEMTKRVGLLASIRGSDPTQAGQATNRVLAGTMGIGEAMTNDIFQQNPALVQALFENIQKMNLDPGDWKTISQEARTKILQLSLAKAAPDVLIKEFEGTFQGTVEGLKTKIFDPITGILGMLRTVDGTGGQTLLSAATGLLDKVMGFKDAVVKLALSFGVNLDPFYYLIKLADWSKGMVNGLTAVMNGKDVLTSVDSFLVYLPEMISSLAEKFIVEADRFLNGFLDGFNLDRALMVVDKVLRLFDEVKLQLLNSENLNKIIDTYSRVQAAIAKVQHEMFWAGISRIPLSMSVWWNEVKVSMRVGINSFIDGTERLLRAIGSFVGRLLNPFDGAFDGVMGVKRDRKEEERQKQAFIDGKPGVGTDLVVPNVTPAGQKDKAAFAPNVTINTAGQSDPNAIAQQVMTALDAQYSKYREEKL
jgi:hypothetical protein